MDLGSKSKNTNQEEGGTLRKGPKTMGLGSKTIVTTHVNEKVEDRFDKQKFVCREAQKIYRKGCYKKSLIPERGLDYRSFNLTTIKDREWQYPAAEPENAVEDLVREFYANAAFAVDDCIAFVRGKQVLFCPAMINMVLLIPEVDDEFYKIYATKCFDLLDKIIEVLGVEGASWLKNIEGSALKIKERMLNRKSKAIHKWICSTMIPTFHTSDVTMDRAILNFCIQQNHRVNFGKVIHQGMKNVLGGATASGLVFPWIITQLCRGGGVYYRMDEATFPPEPYITNFSNFGKIRATLVDQPEEQMNTENDGLTTMKRLDVIEGKVDSMIQRMDWVIGQFAQQFHFDMSTRPSFPYHQIPPPPPTTDDMQE